MFKSLLGSFFNGGERGNTLIQVMIAAGIAGMLSLVLMQQANLQSRIMLTAEATNEMIDLVAQIRGVLSSPAACSATFLGVSPSSGSVSVLQRSYKDSNGKDQLAPVYQVGSGVGGTLNIVGYKVTGPTPNLGSVQLEVHAQKVKAGLPASLGVLGGIDTRKNITLTVTTDPTTGNIATCNSVGSAGGGATDPAAAQNLCATIAGAAWNAAMGQCVLFAGLKPTTAVPIHRSWLALPDVIRDSYAGHNGVNQFGIRGNGNFMQPNVPGPGVSICWPSQATLTTLSIPSVPYDRRVLVEAYVAVLHDGGKTPDEGYVSMQLTSPGTQLLDLIYFMTLEAHSLLLTSVLTQNANTSPQIAIIAKHFVGACAWYSQEPNWKVYEL